MNGKEPRTRFHVQNNSRDSGKFTPLIFFIILAVVVFCVLVVMDLIFAPDAVDILVEFHGLFFDLLIFGILLTVYDNRNRRRDRINILHDQLDDFWDWTSEEGVLRKVGIIKRLIELKHPIPRMTGIFLSGANLFNMEVDRLLLQNSTLERAKFNWAKLSDSFFSGCDLRNSTFEHGKLYDSTIADSDLSHANLNHCHFIEATIRGNVSFRNANLHGAVFENARIVPEASGYPDFTDADLSMANLCGTDLSHCKGLTWQQINSARIDDEHTVLPDYLTKA